MTTTNEVSVGDVIGDSQDVLIPACPNCDAAPFYISNQDLIIAEGWVACDACGAAIYPVEVNGATINVYNAVRDIALFLAYLPEVDQSQTFQLGYGRLVVWQYAADKFWLGLILPGKQDPTTENLLHFTRAQVLSLARSPKA